MVWDACKRWWRGLWNPMPLVGTRWRVEGLGIVYVKRVLWHDPRDKRNVSSMQCWSHWVHRVDLITSKGEVRWCVSDLRQQGVPLKATAKDIKELEVLDRSC